MSSASEPLARSSGGISLSNGCPELRELRYFVALAEDLHFTRAAQRLHIAQQALSTAIRQLEARLGVSLFERTSRQVNLTGAGHALFPKAQLALAAAATARQSAPCVPLQQVPPWQRAGRGMLINTLGLSTHSNKLFDHSVPRP